MAASSRQVPAVIHPVEPNRVTQAILDFVSQIPSSKIGSSGDPETAARRLAQRAAQRAALTAGSLALPPGPLGWLTVLPELIAIWKIQAQMVSDIAAVYGRHPTLGREQMLWCLFRHTAAQAFRDLVIRLGDRLLFRRMSYAVAERVAKQVGVKVTQHLMGKGLARWLPVVGALGVGAYAYYDTGQVASTAIAMFSGPIELAEDEGAAATPAKASTRAAASKAAVAKTSDSKAGATRKVMRNAVTSVVRKVVARKRGNPKPSAKPD